MTVNVLQFVGYSNSGKTTLMSELVERLVHKGCQVGVIKHHAHRDKNQFLNPNKDTGRYQQHGAAVVGMSGPGGFQLASQSQMPLSAYIQFYQEIFDCDTVLVEGYKQAEYTKILVLRHRADWEALQTLENIALIVVPADTNWQPDAAIRAIHNDDPQLLDTIEQMMEGGPSE
ncbi:molybdopterin-guanine dinucleotide biosynthesis protein B [Tuberibacillus sp. Marseille-P3662]|uniref:molybdopterin-guanine dinucleotide biosynthesis protein B n=1 Tax=Tuberibacillus sp. Marseille-P3662 TaxID=1965358 RepID=UPI00111C75F8|nr:molybdopterin-guanine dinucleotide biosynthesis protein B [Tuberibacillus sp. Marseille-P3662]